MKTLYLLRHAKAESGSKILSDKQRPLSARGQQACEGIGAYIAAKKYRPDRVLCSGAVRTRETCARVMQAAKMDWACAFEDRLYLAEAEEVLRQVREVDPISGSIMVVGHNPGMHHLALLLAVSDGSRLRGALELKYPTGSLTALRFDISDWQALIPGTATLLDFVTPDDLEHVD